MHFRGVVVIGIVKRSADDLELENENEHQRTLVERLLQI